MRMKVLLLFLSSLLFLAGCALFVPIVWTDSSDIPQDYGIAFVEITLKGRDSASVFIDDGAARSNKKLILKKGTHLYSLFLEYSTYSFRTLLFHYETFLLERTRTPLNADPERYTGYYCSPWKVEKGKATAIGKIKFDIVENDRFNLKCDEHDSTRQAVMQSAKELYPETFKAVK